MLPATRKSRQPKPDAIDPAQLDRNPRRSGRGAPCGFRPPCHIYRHEMDMDRDIIAANGNPGDEDGTGLGLATKTRTRTKSPSPYKVLMLNDDYTPMEFVVHVLQSFFKMSIEDATRVMLHVHQRGVGVCGIFPYEVAETKVAQVMDFARKNEHPLQCTLEKA